MPRAVKGQRFGGRAKGSKNKTTALLKDALLIAADGAGGKDGLVGYLRTQATANPAAFMSLLGKVLPLQLTGDGGGPIQVRDERNKQYVNQIVELVQQAALKRAKVD